MTAMSGSCTVTRTAPCRGVRAGESATAGHNATTSPADVCRPER